MSDKELNVILQNLQSATMAALDLYHRSLAQLPEEKRENIKRISADQPTAEILKKITDALSN